MCLCILQRYHAFLIYCFGSGFIHDCNLWLCISGYFLHFLGKAQQWNLIFLHWRRSVILYLLFCSPVQHINNLCWVFSRRLHLPCDWSYETCFLVFRTSNQSYKLIETKQWWACFILLPRETENALITGAAVVQPGMFRNCLSASCECTSTTEHHLVCHTDTCALSAGGFLNTHSSGDGLYY